MRRNAYRSGNRGGVRAAGRAKWCIALTLLSLLVAACGPPITVRRVAAHQVTAELARSALNSNRPSLFSENTLNRWGLSETFARDRELALAALHQRLPVSRNVGSTLFALAELSFLHADASRRREFYLAAVVYAYAFLFPEDPVDIPVEFDPRVRIAADLYNRGLTRAFATADGTAVELRSGLYTLPFGRDLTVQLDDTSLEWAHRRLNGFVPVAELEVRGLGTRFRNPGIGAPLAASVRTEAGSTAVTDFVAEGMRVPVTALLRIAEPRRQAQETHAEASLRVYNHYDAQQVEIGDRSVPLEAEPSATLAYSLSRSRIWTWERFGILRGDLISGEFERPLAFVEPYRPGRIPVVFVHGTASSPGRWADMVNVLSNTRRLRDRFQYWFFFYDTGNPIPYSALRLRRTLSEAVRQLDPDGSDPALRQMVIVGHSQGGLLTRLAAVDAEDRLWHSVSKRSIEEIEVNQSTRALLREMFFFEALPFLRRVVFIATPHRGSFVAEYSLVNLLARFVRLPQNLTAAAGDFATGNADALRFSPRRPTFGSIYGMRPGSPFLVELAATPLAAGVEGHSIIAIRGAPPPAGQTDGVVSFDSARLDGVASELIVAHTGHSVQGHPVAIEEVQRILIEHADAVCATERVACGPASGRTAGRP